MCINNFAQKYDGSFATLKRPFPVLICVERSDRQIQETLNSKRFQNEIILLRTEKKITSMYANGYKVPSQTNTTRINALFYVGGIEIQLYNLSKRTDNVKVS